MCAHINIQCAAGLFSLAFALSLCRGGLSHIVCATRQASRGRIFNARNVCDPHTHRCTVNKCYFSRSFIYIHARAPPFDKYRVLCLDSTFLFTDLFGRFHHHRYIQLYSYLISAPVRVTIVCRSSNPQP